MFLAKELRTVADIYNIDMENESFSYLLPKSGSRSHEWLFFAVYFISIVKIKFLSHREGKYLVQLHYS